MLHGRYILSQICVENPETEILNFFLVKQIADTIRKNPEKSFAAVKSIKTLVA